MNLLKKWITPGVMVLIVATSGSHVLADGGWHKQTIPMANLQQGWQMIWLEVDPVPDDPASVLAGVDFESVWTFVPSISTGRSGVWVVYYTDPQLNFLNTLAMIRGKRGYLIKINSVPTVDLEIVGRPILRKQDFSSQEANLFGSTSDPGNPPSFNAYFSHPNVQGKVAIFGLVNDNLAPIASTSAISPNTAYWINLSQTLSYGGPIQLNVALDGIQFGINGYSEELVLELPIKAIPQIITIKPRASEIPPPGEPKDKGGGDISWLEYLDITNSLVTNVWRAFPAGGLKLTVPADEAQASVEVRAVRNGRKPADLDTSGSVAELYQGIIEITEPNGVQLLMGTGMEIVPVGGLWVGQARMLNVNVQSGIPNPSGNTEAPALAMRLILAIEDDGSAKLMNSTFIETDRDGRILRYHYNAVMFHEDVNLNGSIIDGHSNEMLTQTMVINANHPLNPYRHRYNPEHLNGYTIDRTITMRFTLEDPDPLNQQLGLTATLGDNELVGEYTEEIKGLANEIITVTGCFKLHRLSRTTQLLPTP